jgi:hypothetical protein
MPVQVGGRLVALNGHAVSFWSFWELTDKLKHLPLPLALEFIRTSEHVLLIARALCEFRRTSRNRRYAPAGHLLRGVWPSIMYNDHAL